MHVGPDPELVPWDAHRYLRTVLVDAFMRSGRHPVVIPVRDLIRSLITMHNRRGRRVPEGEMLTFHADAIRVLADFYATRPAHVFWLPIDLWADFASRLGLLRGLAEFTGAPAGPEDIEDEAEAVGPGERDARGPRRPPRSLRAR